MSQHPLHVSTLGRWAPQPFTSLWILFSEVCTLGLLSSRILLRSGGDSEVWQRVGNRRDPGLQRWEEGEAMRRG